MSRKDYEQVAGAIRRTVDEWPDRSLGRVALLQMARRMADVFAFDNPRFDRARFMAACGFDN